VHNLLANTHLTILRYDNRAKDLTKEGMRRGIQQAAAFLLFLSDGVLERPFCQVIAIYINIVLHTE
jgi:hypothetical protein